MLTNIIIVVLAVVGISDGFFNLSKGTKPGVEIPKPSDYDGKGGEKRGGWDHN